MKAAVWNATGQLDVVDRPVPEPKPGWARVLVSAVGICGTDLHFFRGGFPSPAGLLPGHEVGGVVDLLTEGAVAPGIEVGAPVAVEPLTGCGTCPQCAAGLYNRCPRRMLFGVTGRGGMAELMTVPSRCLYPLPPVVPLTQASMVEPMAVCVRGVRLAGVVGGDRVIVLGAGTIGLLSVLAARAAGAASVAVTARHPRQRELARAFGAEVLSEAEGLAGAQALAGGAGEFDVVLETVGGHADTLTAAVGLCRPGGTIGLLGVFDRPVPLAALEVSTKELRIVGSNCYSRAELRPDFAIGADLLAAHADAVAELVTHRFPLGRVNDAFATAADKSTGSIKVIIEP